MKSALEILGGSAYSKLLDSPEWESFSSRVRSSKGNICECCRLGEKTTQIHHVFYDGRKPWEYSQDDVVLLCKECHTGLHKGLQDFRKYVFRRLKPVDFRILNAALSVAFSQYSPTVFVHALAEFVSNKHLVENYAKSWGMDSNGHADKTNSTQVQ